MDRADADDWRDAPAIPRPRAALRRPGPTTHDGKPVGIRAWVAAQVACQPGQLREIRSAILGPGVQEYRYIVGGTSAVVATVARQQPGRYRIRAAWGGRSVEEIVTGSILP